MDSRKGQVSGDVALNSGDEGSHRRCQFLVLCYTCFTQCGHAIDFFATFRQLFNNHGHDVVPVHALMIENADGIDDAVVP